MEAVLTRRGCCHCALNGAHSRKAQHQRAITCKAVLAMPKETLQTSHALGTYSSCPSSQSSGFHSTSPPPLLSGHRLTERGSLGERRSHVVGAAPGDNTAKWWEREGGPNVRDVHSIGDFVEELAGAGENLVVVEFYASWCGSCRALLPKFLKIAAEHPDVTFLKVNFDECKAMCKSLNIKVLPFFHFYRGADGRLDAFSASISKLAKLREAIETHNTARCSLGPAVGVGPDFDWEAAAKANAAAAAANKAAAAH